MKRSLIIFLFLTTQAFAAREAFVVNNLAETMSRIDLENGQVHNHIVQLGETPNQIAYHDGYLYVVNSISANIQKIDPSSYQVVADILLPVGSNPYSIAFDDGHHAYVSGWVSGAIYRIDLATSQQDGELAIGEYPEGMIYANGRLYAVKTAFNPNDFSYGQGKMTIIDPVNMLLAGEVNVGKNPQSINLAPDGTLHIACTGNYADVNGSVYVYNIGSGQVTDSILIGGQPVSGVVAANGIVYLAAGGWVSAGYIFAYDSQTHQIIRGAENPILSGLGVSAVAVDSFGYLYSCNFGDDTVGRLDSTGQLLGSYILGDGPNSMVILEEPLKVNNDGNVSLPGEFGLRQCYPNPFNSQTMIDYLLPHKYLGRAQIQIFDVRGGLIKRLPLETGRRYGSVLWDGNNDHGEICSSGTYFARLVFSNGSIIENGYRGVLKMILLK